MSASAFAPTSATRIHFTPAPVDLRAWAAGAVAVRLDRGLDTSRFPASIAGMLVVRLEGQSWTDDGRPVPAAALIGPSATPTRFRQAGPLVACGLLLHPPTVALLCGRPHRWTHAEVFDLDDLLASQGAALRERLRHAPDDGARCGWLWAWLRSAIAARPRATTERALIAAALPPLIARGLDEACRELGLGARQLERRSLELLGMPPQRVHAVLRMQGALLSAMRAPQAPAGADLALSHRYCDQSHMGRDLRRLAGAPLGRIIAASRSPGDELWAFSVGRAQARG